VFALRLRLAGRRIGGRGEFVKAVDDDQASAGAEIAAVGAHVVDRLAARAGPAPAAHHQLRAGVGAAHDRRGIGDADAFERRQIRKAVGEAQRNALLAERIDDLAERDEAADFIAHRVTLTELG
jgi:hypothetical protein